MLCSRRLIVSVVRNRCFQHCLQSSSVACGYVDKFNATNNLGNFNNYNNDITNRRDNLKVIKRFKYNKKQSTKEEDEESDDDLDDVLEDKNAHVLKMRVNSLRLDLVLKAGLNVARNKVETAFYESRIRVNGGRVLKKSEQLRVGDEIDIVRGPSPSNPDFLVVSRIQLLDAKENTDNISIKLTRNKALVIENYSDPWKAGSSQAQDD